MSSSLRQYRLYKPALLQLLHQPAVGKVLRLGAFRFGIGLLQSLNQASDSRNRWIRRNGEIGFDRRLITFFENFLIVGPEIFAHDPECKAFIFLTASRPFNVRF